MNIREAATIIGKKGGKTTKKKYGKKYYSELGKKGMKSRWNKNHHI